MASFGFTVSAMHGYCSGTFLILSGCHLKTFFTCHKPRRIQVLGCVLPLAKVPSNDTAPCAEMTTFRWPTRGSLACASRSKQWPYTSNPSSNDASSSKTPRSLTKQPMHGQHPSPAPPPWVRTFAAFQRPVWGLSSGSEGLGVTMLIG